MSEIDAVQDDKLKLLGKLSASLVHDLRNPLSAVKLNLDYLKMIENELPNEAVESVDVCLDALTRIQYLIDDILTFTRKNFNGQKICSINGITKSAYDIMHTNAERKNINLILDLDPSLPGVYFDKSKLLQVFINLITNAIESCDSSGEILIKTSLEDKEYLIWEIKDNGMGISEENKRNIFQDFYTSKEKGTGLGLSVCKMLLEENQAKIDFESTSGVGTRFFIKFNLELKQENVEIQNTNHR
jgi:signal transduction histidine kinase